VALIGLLLPLAPALVATPAQAATGRVRGTISGTHGDASPRVKVTWFAADWTFLGSRKAHGGGYSLALEPGTYHLQFTDQRPAYDVEKYYPADVLVTVTAAATTVKNVKMRTGASIGGVVEAHGRPAGGARIVAANTDRNSFETTANSQGEFALGGLPPGSYSVFTYDKRKAWVGKSDWFPRLKSGKFKKAHIDLTKKAGRFVVDLYAGDQPYPGVAYVTAVSRGNGQFWTQKVAHGTVTFAGLYPGKYDLVVPAAGGYLGGTLKVQGKVKPGKTSFGTLRLTQRGASVSGYVVDANHPSSALAGATVTLVDGAGTTLGSTTTGADGGFLLGGQLTTRADLRVVAGPGPYSPYLGQGTSYCKYGPTSVDTAVTTGQTTALGSVRLPHLPDDQQDGAQCHTPPAT
jgi:hypothetical protein